MSQLYKILPLHYSAPMSWAESQKTTMILCRSVVCFSAGRRNPISVRWSLPQLGPAESQKHLRNNSTTFPGGKLKLLCYPVMKNIFLMASLSCYLWQLFLVFTICHKQFIWTCLQETTGFYEMAPLPFSLARLKQPKDTNLSSLLMVPKAQNHLGSPLSIFQTLAFHLGNLRIDKNQSTQQCWEGQLLPLICSPRRPLCCLPYLQWKCIFNSFPTWQQSSYPIASPQMLCSASCFPDYAAARSWSAQTQNFVFILTELHMSFLLAKSQASQDSAKLNFYRLNALNSLLCQFNVICNFSPGAFHLTI